MKNKKGIEFGFSWIFAIIVGAIIIFIAIYAATRLIGTERRVSDTFIAAELNNLIHPIETNLEDSKYVKIKFLDETRFYNECQTTGNFGKQQISTSTKLGIGNDWGQKSVRKSSFNKYLFSREVEEGKELNVIVKPFYNPYKVGDLTFVYSGDYCFVNPPAEIEEELEELSGNGNLEIGINVTTNANQCPQGKTIVCFNQIGCDINVNLGSRIVSRSSPADDVFYDGDLIYAAIFSDKELYECQIKRLMKRTNELAYIYSLKSGFLTGQGCSNNLQGDLVSFANILSNTNSSEDFLDNVAPIAEDLRRKNDAISKCKLF